VKRIAAGVLFLRPGILYWLKSRVSDRRMLTPLLHAYQEGQHAVMRGAQYPILNLSTEARREIFDRLERAAAESPTDLRAVNLGYLLRNGVELPRHQGLAGRAIRQCKERSEDRKGGERCQGARFWRL
jgi:hypothetical protein